VWKELGFADAFRRLLRNPHQFDAERLLRVMVFNRLCRSVVVIGPSRLACSKGKQVWAGVLTTRFWSRPDADGRWCVTGNSAAFFPRPAVPSTMP
jgi:hypothetical protein